MNATICIAGIFVPDTDEFMGRENSILDLLRAAFKGGWMVSILVKPA